MAFGKMIIMTIPAFFAFEILGKIFGEKPPKMDQSNVPTTDQASKDAPKTDTIEGKQPSEIQKTQEASSEKVDTSTTKTSESSKPSEPSKPDNEAPSTPLNNQKSSQSLEGQNPSEIKVDSSNQMPSKGPDPNISPENLPGEPNNEINKKNDEGDEIDKKPVEKSLKPEADGI